MNLRTFVLHCSELPERTNAVRAHLNERSVPATFVRGIHGRSWGLLAKKEFAPGKYLPPGHVGLNLGSWFLHQHILLAQPNDPQDAIYCLFEDDVCLPEDYWGQLDSLERELNDHIHDWDLVFLGLAEREPHVWHKVTERIGPPNSRLCRMNDPFGTHAYLVRRRALPVLLDHMAKAERNLDQQLFSYVLKPGFLKWCAVVPSIVTQRTFDYAGAGKPEWAPSCVDPTDKERRPVPQAPAIRADVADMQRMAGFHPPEPEPPHERPTLVQVQATTLLTDPYPCMYRGEPLEGNGKLATGRTVPLFQCARLNVPCHSKSGKAVDEDGFEAKECRTCHLRTEMAPDAPRPRLPIPAGHFNPSIALWNGELILATRDSWGHSRVALWKLKNARPDWSGDWTASPVGSFASNHPEAPRLEDPRLFVAPHPATGQPHLHAMFNLPDGYPPKRVQVGYVRFARDLSGIEVTEVFRSPNNNVYEKNWVPFVCPGDDDIYWVYGTKPHHNVMGRACWSTPNNLPWTGGVARGGAAPVLVSPDDFPHAEKRDCFYHFFHGCLKRIQGSVYTMGCVVFDAHPPFQVLRQTPVPLLWPDLPAPNEDVTKRYVCWPGGAVLHAGAWHVAIGVDDSFSRIVRIPVETVEAALSDVPETTSVTSIRNTKIAMGIHESEKPSVL